jgi:hypothetical protein
MVARLDGFSFRLVVAKSENLEEKRGDVDLGWMTVLVENDRSHT